MDRATIGRTPHGGNRLPPARLPRFNPIMSERTVIRPADPAEAGRLLDLVGRIDGESDFLPREPGERPVWCAGAGHPAAGLAAFLARAHCALFVALADGEPVGFLSASGGRLARNRDVVILSAGILRDHRGNGIGTSLFREAESWARNTGARRLELTVVTANAGAERLYRRLGYVDEGTMRDSLRIRGASFDERLMAKPVGASGMPDWPPLAFDAPPPRPDTGLTIRPAGPEDAAAYLACDRAVRAETPFLLRTADESLADEAAARRLLEARRNAARATTLVAATDHGIVGTLSVWAGGSARSAHIASLVMAVRRDHWGSGIGCHLLAGAEAWARSHRFARLTLWVPGHSPRARRFFEAAGFACEATARRYALIDGRLADQCFMAKALGGDRLTP